MKTESYYCYPDVKCKKKKGNVTQDQFMEWGTEATIYCVDEAGSRG